jgi:23S rRNA G2445 N2-methylase RlmL
VDDVFLSLGSWDEILPQRVALERIRLKCRELDLPPAAAIIAGIRALTPRPSFSVTVNFVGKRNYTSEEVKTAAAEEISQVTGWVYGSENESELNLRLFIEHDRAYVGLRLSAYPLHSRLYKQAHISGSLKPTVAAAMLQILEPWPAALTLDPFCGAGTIPIEAGLMGAQPLGFDRDPAALLAAKQNAQHAAVYGPLAQADACCLPLAAGAVDFTATNLPWGRQVQVDQLLAELYHRACGEIERVTASYGRVVLLTSQPELVAFQRLELRQQIEISLFGQIPSILLFAR